MAPPGDAGIGRDPPGVASHHLHHHHAVVRLGGGVQPVDGVGGDLTAVLNPNVMSVPTTSLSIVFGTPTIGRPRSRWEIARDRQRAVAADDHQRAETHVGERLAYMPRGRRHGRTDYLRRVPSIVPPEATCRSDDTSRRHATFHHTVPRADEADQLVAVDERLPCGRPPGSPLEAWGSHPHLSECQLARRNKVGQFQERSRKHVVEFLANHRMEATVHRVAGDRRRRDRRLLFATDNLKPESYIAVWPAASSPVSAPCSPSSGTSARR